MVSPGFSYRNNSRNVRPHRLSFICSICFGVMGVTLPGRPSCNDVTGWDRSSILSPGIQVGGYIENRGIDFYRLAKEKGLEGIVAKRKSSIYRPGKRSPDWLKIKSRPQKEFVVCGFTEGKGSRKHFGALPLGAYRNGKLPYFGHSGTGFSERNEGND
jgi:ATP-dependent DNA ligase